MASGNTPTYRNSQGGVERRDALQKEFENLLESSALTHMRRRGSNTLDEADFSNAYNELLSAQNAQIDWPRQVIGVVVILVGGVIGSFAVQYFPTCTTNLHYAGAVGGVAGGLAVGVLGTFIQLYPHWKK